MNDNFTPGPWERCDRGDYNDFNGNSNVILGDDMRIAVVQNSGCDEQEANAHLIAAAPELYAALKKLTIAMQARIDGDGATKTELHEMDDARNALKKARGEE